MNKTNKTRRTTSPTRITNDRRISSLRKLGLETLETRELLSASTYSDVAALVELTADAIAIAQESELAPIDLTNAVGDTIVVANANDSGAGSLRQAIADAEPGATITFDSSLYGQTITLSNEITINKDLTIVGGEGDNRVTIDGNNSTQIFNAPSSAGSEIDLELSNLNIVNGRSNHSVVRFSSRGGSLTVTDCDFQNNAARSGGSLHYGGAIRFENGANCTITDSTFTGNSASRGGAIYFDSNANCTITGCAFTGNSATNGGAVCSNQDEAVVTIDNCGFADNTATDGGALYFFGGTSHTILNSSFNDNGASDSGGVLYLNNGVKVECLNVSATGNTASTGGAGYFYRSEATFTNSLIVDNQSGLYFNSNSNGTFVNSTIANNDDYGIGGSHSNVTLKNSILYNNGVTATLYEAYNSILDKTYSISGGSANNIVYGDGDVLFNDAENGNYTLANGSIAIDVGNNDYAAGIDYDFRGAPYRRIVNVAVDAGAYERQEEASIVVTTPLDVVDPTDGLVSLREAVEIYFAYEERIFDSTVDPTGKTVTFKFNPIVSVQIDQGEITISDSMAIYGDNGADGNIALDTQYDSRIFKVADGVESVAFEKLDFYHGATMQLDSVQPGSAYDETQEALNGGAIYAGDANITVKDSLFNANWGYIGGAIFVNGGTLAVDGATFEDNLSVYQGGAIAVYASAADDEALTIENSAFAGNKSDRAGAVYFKNGEATISNTTFDENEARFANGGAITVANSTVSLADVELIGNTAERFGGAIFAGQSDVVIENGENVMIDSNAAQYGGAIYNSKGELEVVSGQFTDNVATGSGGAIYSGGEVTVIATFEGNEAGESGGAIYAGGALVVEESTFTENVATSSGGAIYATKGDVSIAESAFNQNESTGSGGAIRLAKLDSAAVTDSTFAGNKAGATGGAISASATKTFTVEDDSFTDNAATNSGGAIYATTGTAVLSKNANYAGNASEKFGGALAIAGATLTVTEGEFRENEANSGGAIYVTTGAVEVNSATISGNTATSYGAGVYAVESDVKATDTTISGNTATTAGGAIFAAQGGKVTVELSTVSGNKATNGAGGAIYASSADAVVVSGSSITTNTASGSGGAIFAHKTDVFVEALNGVGATLTKNESGKFGGAVYAVDGSGYVGYHFFDGVDFAENTAVAGGAIYGSNSSFKVSDVDFDENAATERGGAIFITAGESVAVESSNFSGNTATQAGGALYLDKSESTVKDSTFEGNGAQNGGALEQVSGTLAVEDSYFEKNVAQGVGGAIYQLHGTSTLSKVEFAENEATTKAGAVYVGAGASTISGSTFSGNVASRGTAIAALNATSLEIDGEAFPTSGAIEEEDLSSAILDEAFAELFFEELD